MESKVTAVVCPVFNEPDTWQSICAALARLFDIVVVVDDGSDIPIESALENVVVLRNERNLGKGQALAKGFRACLDRGATTVGTIDSDGEHDPRNFKCALAVSDDIGVVNFSRELIFPKYGRARRYRNRAISKKLSKKLGVEVRDSQSGMRLFSADAIRFALDAGLPEGYAIETVMLTSLSRAGFKFREIPMTYTGLQRDKKRLYNKKALWNDCLVFFPAMLPEFAWPTADARRNSPIVLTKPLRGISDEVQV